MAKKSNAKRSKSGTKTPNREPGASRPASPEPQGQVGEEDGPQGEDQVKTEDQVVKDKEAVEAEGAATATGSPETRSSQQVEAANGEDELEEPTKVNGTAGHHADEERTEVQASIEDTTTDSSPVDGNEEAAKNGVAGIDLVTEATSIPAEGVVADSTGTEEKEAQTDAQEDTVAHQEDASVKADVDQRIREAEVEAETEDNNGEIAEGDEAGEEEEEDDEDQEQDRIQALESELAQTVREKEHLSTQYRTLLGKLQAMRNSLGEKLKEDAVSAFLCLVDLLIREVVSTMRLMFPVVIRYLTCPGRTRSPRSLDQPIDDRPPSDPSYGDNRPVGARLTFSGERFPRHPALAAAFRKPTEERTGF